jgi:Tfp pilus assembly protein PilZ
MDAQRKEQKKYHPMVSKLLKVVVNLKEEQQLAVLRYAEEFLVKEKRTNIRKSCDIPLNYATNNRVFTNTIKNISRSGLFIETQRPLIVGDEIVMSFKLEGFDRPLKIKGEIAHATREGVGVEFKGLSPYVKEMIGVIVKRMK